MKEQDFTLTAGNEFIPLDKLLKLLGLASSGGEAHQLILDGAATLNGEVVREKRKKIRSGDVVIFDNNTVRVSK